MDIKNSQIDSKSGFENKQIRILKYSDYKLKQVN